ncbi:hypothetical protein EKL97_14160 [Flavobacterium sp. LS1P28]|uniref:hypothetical protein n=1 Tax=Flavobacterium sp. LS1P28 TaxID=2497752 RepID=UPI000F83F601|nr:hypothetical protein [Flavobacterium sp. LS1P28]RTY78244.1 hypothetical protein EKL97_14160 [Flavobacterium sp. LS1P28]
MKIIIAGLALIILIISCGNKTPTKFVETPLSKNYFIEIPIKFKKFKENSWKFPEHTYLGIVVANETASNLEDELKSYVNYYSSQEMFNGQTFVKKEKFEINGFKGLISYYEKDNKGKRLGLVNLKSYIVYAVIQDNTNRILLNSISFNNNINDDLSKSIKSIKLKKALVNKTQNDFDETKAQIEGFQVFKNENFIIKCKGKLLLDILRVEQLEQNGLSDNSKPFHVFVKGIDYNINVSDLSNVLEGQNKEELSKHNQEDLTYYQTKFDEMAIKNQRGKFKNIDAVYYQNSQENRQSKAVYFHHKMKSYMLQVTSKQNTDKLFNEFINSFEIIKL